MSKGLPTILVVLALVGSSMICGAAQVTPSATPQTAKEVGAAASEVLRGNGTRAGYVLGHGSVIVGSETVYVGAKRARKNTDYTIDYSSGSLFFSELVSASDSVRVDYQYTEGGKADRTVSSPGGMQLKFGAGTQTNLTYSYRTADQDQGGADVLTYGASTTGKIGGSSSISSMLYVATPQVSNRLSISSKPTETKNDPTTVKNDQLMVQNADLGSDGMRFTVGYQDVGENFAGFDALRESGAAKADVLKQLEKEKGINRLNLGSELKIGADAKLNFSRESIEDKESEIITQSAGYSGARMRFGLNTRDVAKTFTRFKDLRESDRAQIAKEAGLSRSQYFLQFKTMDSKDSSAGWSSFTNTTLASEEGELTYRTADLDLGKIKFEANVRSASPEFDGMKAITDDERTHMALAARQQFDPSAQATAIIAKDKARVKKEAGLDRESYRAQYDVGPVWLSLAKSNINSLDGGISRTDYFVQHKAFKLHFGHHHIDEQFNRLSSMQSTELTHFGNEYGMSRTDMDGQFKFGVGDLEVTHKRVADQQGATVSRDKFDLKITGGEFHANIQNIDPRFSRLADLSDADRALLAQDLGFKRSDYSIGVTALRNVKVKSYFYDSSNITAGQTRNQRKHELSYDGPRGLKVTGLMDDFSYMSDTGNISSYSRRKLTFDNKFKLFGEALRFSGLNDTNTSEEETEGLVTTEVTQAHFETNPGGKTSYTFDSLQMDLGKGRFENTQGVGFKTRMSNHFALLGSFSRTDRDTDPEANASFGLDWIINQDLKMNLNVTNRDGGLNGNQRSRQFSLNGTIVKNAVGFENVKVGSAVNTNDLAGKQTNCNNALNVNGKFMRGDFLFDNSDKLNPNNGIYYSSRIIRYESDKDPKKWYHITYFRQNLITPTNEFARKRNYALDMKVNSCVNATATSYFGKDGQSGAVLPVGGGVFKLNYTFPGNTTLFADYSADLNESTLRRARTAGLGFTRALPNGSNIELYWGLSRLTADRTHGADTVFRVKYERKLNMDHYISLYAQKQSAVDNTTINPYEGNVTASLEFKTTFH